MFLVYGLRDRSRIRALTAWVGQR